VGLEEGGGSASDPRSEGEDEDGATVGFLVPLPCSGEPSPAPGRCVGKLQDGARFSPHRCVNRPRRAASPAL